MARVLHATTSVRRRVLFVGRGVDRRDLTEPIGVASRLLTSADRQLDIPRP